jgi:hypothetical protein
MIQIPKQFLWFLIVMSACFALGAAGHFMFIDALERPVRYEHQRGILKDTLDCEEINLGKMAYVQSQKCQNSEVTCYIIPNYGSISCIPRKVKAHVPNQKL